MKLPSESAVTLGKIPIQGVTNFLCVIKIVTDKNVF